MHRLAFQFAEGIRGDPACRTRILLSDFLRHGNGGAIQPLVSLSNVAQCPVYGFANKIAFVVRFPFDDQQKLFKSGIGTGFVFICQIGRERERSTLDEFLWPAAPGF